MQVLEAPVLVDWPLTGDRSYQHGQFVLISFDGAASVAPLDDAEATRAALSLPHDKYLALVFSLKIETLGPPQPPQGAGASSGSQTGKHSERSRSLSPINSSSSDANQKSTFTRPVDEDLERLNTKLRQRRLYFEVWLDLATCGEPTDLRPPSTIKQILGDVQKIWADWEERAMTEVMAKRPHTSAWIQSITAVPGDEELPNDYTEYASIPAVDVEVEAHESEAVIDAGYVQRRASPVQDVIPDPLAGPTESSPSSKVADAAPGTKRRFPFALAPVLRSSAAWIRNNVLRMRGGPSIKPAPGLSFKSPL